MADAGRARRLSGRIKQIVATQLEMGVKDPRLGMVTITDSIGTNNWEIGSQIEG